MKVKRNGYTLFELMFAIVMLAMGGAAIFTVICVLKILYNMAF